MVTTDEPLPPNVRLLSRLSATHAGFDLSAERALRALAAAEEAHFWFRSRNLLIEESLIRLGAGPPGRILELGCGAGCVAAHLSGRGFRVTGVDGHLPLVLRAARRAPAADFVVHDLSRGPADLEPGSFDVAGFFDVLEHLDNPKLALEQAIGLIKPGGLLVGTVPALMALWSGVDVQAGHRLRYDASSLRNLLVAIPGARPLEVRPFHRALVPLMWLQRRLVVRRDVASTSENNLRVPPLALNRALFAALRAENALHSRIAWIPGSSLWFALRRTDLHSAGGALTRARRNSAYRAELQSAAQNFRRRVLKCADSTEHRPAARNFDR